MDSLTAMSELMDVSIDNAVISMQSWVNQALTGYYAIAAADAKLSALGARITETDSISNVRMHSLQDSLSQAKTDLTAAYKKAIENAIETSNGTINKKIADEIAAVNTHINFIKGSMTIATDVVEVGAAGDSVSVNVDTDLGYTVKVQDGITWLHDATITTRSVMRHESITLTADASQLAFPRNAVVFILNASGDTLSQYTVCPSAFLSRAAVSLPRYLVPSNTYTTSPAAHATRTVLTRDDFTSSCWAYSPISPLTQMSVVSLPSSAG